MLAEPNQANNDCHIKPLQGASKFIRREFIVVRDIEIQSHERWFWHGLHMVHLLHIISAKLAFAAINYTPC